ncbi:MAG: hypothetical protein AAFX06_31130 [Planctomycetota bacterium]
MLPKSLGPIVYQIDSKDQLLELEDLPVCSVGAPIPAVVGREHFTALCYVAAQPPADGWHGQSATLVDHNSSARPIVVVEFRICADVRFGWFPSEETCDHHPLATRGLAPYTAYEVRDSSWVRSLAKLEAGNRDHALKSKRHFILTFHDSTFECVSDSYTVRVIEGSIQSAMADVLASLADR